MKNMIIIGRRLEKRIVAKKRTDVMKNFTLGSILCSREEPEVNLRPSNMVIE
jgi:hypothetical protein